MIKNGRMMKCQLCKKEVYIPLGRQGDFKFCSRSCLGKNTTSRPEFQSRIKRNYGNDHPRWKVDGSLRKDGYRITTINGRRNFQHRHIMELHLGRKLLRSEHVHHINHNKEDNRVENLEVLDWSDHTTKHHREGMYKPMGWSRFHSSCVDCGTTDTIHWAKGRCRKCLKRYYYNLNKV